MTPLMQTSLHAQLHARLESACGFQQTTKVTCLIYSATILSIQTLTPEPHSSWFHLDARPLNHHPCRLKRGCKSLALHKLQRLPHDMCLYKATWLDMALWIDHQLRCSHSAPLVCSQHSRLIVTDTDCWPREVGVATFAAAQHMQGISRCTTRARWLQCGEPRCGTCAGKVQPLHLIVQLPFADNLRVLHAC